jgi:hypothetical protein
MMIHRLANFNLSQLCIFSTDIKIREGTLVFGLFNLSRTNWKKESHKMFILFAWKGKHCPAMGFLIELVVQPQQKPAI